MHKPRTILSLLIFVATNANAAAQQTYGHDFVTVGAAGNRGTLPEELPEAVDVGSYGAVNYEFRITRTEIRARDWLPFLNAYRPFLQGNPFSSNVTGEWIGINSFNQYAIVSGAEDCPIEVSWEMATRYCNWLHNDRVGEAWAFASGAYDTSLFTINIDGSFNHQSRMSGARYWLPSYDETIKAFYFDPNRYGPGLAGYWLFPGQSNTPLPMGLPENGGMTNLNWNPATYPLPSAGQYPLAASAWGLLDTSGGAIEWTDTRWIDGRMVKVGSRYGSSDYGQIYQDRIDWFQRAGLPTSGGEGFRVVTSIPGPCTAALFAVVSLGIAKERKRR
jgi:formylglycine-generating enzyme required for sulfatase activity